MRQRTPTLGRRVEAGLPALFVVVWSSGYLVGDVGSHAGPPLALLFWRFTLAAAVLAAIAMATGAAWPRRGHEWIHLLVTGVLLHTVQFAGVYLGLSLGVSAGLAALIVSTGPLLIAVASVPIFAERLTPRQWLGLTVGLAGVAVAVGAQLSGTSGTAGLVAMGIGLGGFVGGTLYQKRFGQRMDLRTGATIQLLGATATSAPLAWLHGGLALPVTGAALGSVAWLALVNSIGGFTLLFVLLRRSGGGSATSYLFLVPPLTALLAVPLLGQTVTFAAVGGIVLAAAGVALVTRAPEPKATSTDDAPGRRALDESRGCRPPLVVGASRDKSLLSRVRQTTSAAGRQRPPRDCRHASLVSERRQ